MLNTGNAVLIQEEGEKNKESAKGFPPKKA
jgi:hypothetical protein